MRELNAAVAVVLAALTEQPARPAAGRSPASSPDASRAGASAAWSDHAHHDDRRTYDNDGRTYDEASFVIEALPAEAFEALLVVTTWLGEAVADDPPYRLDVVLHPPVACWCRLDVVPDAGASTVALTLSSLDDRARERAAGLPDIDLVRDLWVAALNELGDGDRLLDER